MASEMAQFGQKLFAGYVDGVDEPGVSIYGQFDLRHHFILRYYKFVICPGLCGSFCSNGSSSLVLTNWFFNFEAEQGMKTVESEPFIWSFFLNNWDEQVEGKTH